MTPRAACLTSGSPMGTEGACVLLWNGQCSVWQQGTEKAMRRGPWRRQH